MQMDVDNAIAAVVTVIGAGGAGALITAWWNGRTNARKQDAEDKRKEAEEQRLGAKQTAELDREAGEWERAAKIKEEDFITSMRKRLVLEMKADNDNIRRRLDDRENAERELREECEDLRKQCRSLQDDHAKCQKENEELRLQIKVLQRAVKVIEKKQGDSDEKTLFPGAKDTDDDKTGGPS